MAPGGPDLHHETPRTGAHLVAMSTLDLAATIARGVAAAAAEILDRFTWPPQVNEADRLSVNLAANAAIRECFQRRLAATPRATSTGSTDTGRTSDFDWLGHRTLTPLDESKWAPRPEMTPRRIDRGWLPHREQETQRVVSQKHRSQSRPRNEADPKKGRTESKGKPGKILVGIDWSTTGIQKPASKLDSRSRLPNLIFPAPV